MVKIPSNILFYILIVVLLLVLMGGLYFSGQKQSVKPTVSPSPSISKPPRSDEGRFCIQVITPAKNSQTGECKEFPTPCDVPEGWEKVGSCD